MSYKFNPFTGTLDDVGPNNGNGVPGGSDTQVQFNDGGVFGGDADLTWNKTTNVLDIGGDVVLDDGGFYTTTLQTITPTLNRTISFPDATGTVALVSGSSGQVVYNNAGANAGVGTLTYDGSILTTSGRFINSYSSTSLAPAKVFTGTWVTGQGTTNTKPHFLIEPAGTTSTAWSSDGTGLGINSEAGFTGNLLDLQKNATSQFNVFHNGNVTAKGDISLDDGGTYTTTLQTITPLANRTISLPDATGTVALVAGSSGQLVYNNAGAQAGAPGSTVGATGNITLSLNGAASVPPVAVTGTWLVGTTPQVQIQPSNVGTTGAWSASGTGLGINAVTAFGGNLLDLQVNGTSLARVNSVGQLTVPSGTKTAPSIKFGASPWGLFERAGVTIDIGNGTNSYYSFQATAALLASGVSLAWSSGFPDLAGSDCGLARSAAGVVKVTNGSSGDGTISGQHRLVGTAPASATATGAAGDIRYDADYIYICTATNTWKRSAIITWV